MTEPLYVPEIVSSQEMEQGEDLFEAGFLRTQPGDRLVAVAVLNETTVAISRGTDGRVRVEIQDETEEPVYVSINAFTATADMSAFTPERPWNE